MSGLACFRTSSSSRPRPPEITEKLWGFAQAAYLDNPLPSVFKERLFVHLSRFCAVRYCIARHTGFLIDSNALGTKITAVFPAEPIRAKERGGISLHGIA